MKDGVQTYADEFITLMNKIGWLSTDTNTILQFKMGLPEWMISHMSTAEAQHELTMEAMGHQAVPIGIEILTKLALRIEANDRILSHDKRETSRDGSRDVRRIQETKPGGKGECRRCGKPGHYAENCRNPRPVKLFGENTNFSNR
jgi:hypothetical protein